MDDFESLDEALGGRGRIPVSDTRDLMTGESEGAGTGKCGVTTVATESSVGLDTSSSLEDLDGDSDFEGLSVSMKLGSESGADVTVFGVADITDLTGDSTDLEGDSIDFDGDSNVDS